MTARTIKKIALCLPLLLISCGGTDSNDCESEAREYAVTHYQAQSLEYNQELRQAMADVGNKPAAPNSQIEWKKFAVALKANIQTYYVQSFSVSLLPLANACSPSLGTARQSITGISITSPYDFNEQYPAGSELAGLFTALDQPFSSVTDMTAIGFPAPIALTLYLREAPTEGLQHFRIALTLSDASQFQLTTGSIYLK